MSRFTVAGVSVHKGTVKVRFCSDKVLRIKNLQKQGDTDINLVDLPSPMTKVEACNFLISSGQFTKYETDIQEIQGKKVHRLSKPITVTIASEKVDPEIDAIKELALA